MSETVTVRRWSRFGADRLVVTGDTGGQVGWIDLRSGEVVAQSPLLEGTLRRAAQEYLRVDVTELVVPTPRWPQDAFGVFWTIPALDPVEAEASVADRLERLVAEGWLVLTDVPVGRQGGLLDHLLIGPGGVYAVRIHPHPGADVRVSRTGIQIDGRPTTYLRDARLEQARVESLLGAASGLTVAVRVVIVLGDAVLTSSSLPEAALVLARADIPDVFRRMPPRLAATRVETIRASAARRATWMA